MAGRGFQSSVPGVIGSADDQTATPSGKTRHGQDIWNGNPQLTSFDFAFSIADSTQGTADCSNHVAETAVPLPVDWRLIYIDIYAVKTTGEPDNLEITSSSRSSRLNGPNVTVTFRIPRIIPTQRK